VASWLRHWRIGALVAVVALFAGWLLYQNQQPVTDWQFDGAKQRDTAEGWREYSRASGKEDVARRELARLHDAARARMRAAGVPRPDALDPILAGLLASVDSRMKLTADKLVIDHRSFRDVEPQLQRPEAELWPIDKELEKVGEYSCASGFSAAFVELTGSDVISVAADAPDDAVRITLTWSARATGAAYAKPHGRRVFPGFEVKAELALSAPALTLSETVTPGREFEYTTDSVAAGLDFDQGSVASGMVSAICKALGERLIEKLTGQKPPAPAVPDAKKLESDCEDSVASACLALGKAERDKGDRKRALEYLTKGCRASGLEIGEACVAAAELELEGPPGDKMADMDRRARASVMLDQGCRAHHARACGRRAELELSGHDTSAYAVREALILLLRACDLGEPASCHRAARLYADALSPRRAAALAARACNAGEKAACADAQTWGKAAKTERKIFDITLSDDDEVFDVRFGQWFELETSEVVWVATRRERDRVSDPVSPGARGRVYAPNALPPGPRPPAWARTVYALVAAPSRPEASPCPECTPGAAHNALASLGCTCLPLP
jgi:hypothetical protein